MEKEIKELQASIKETNDSLKAFAEQATALAKDNKQLTVERDLSLKIRPANPPAPVPSTPAAADKNKTCSMKNSFGDSRSAKANLSSQIVCVAN